MSKINLFEDKEYDKMEWLNKAVEPYLFPQNELLMSMPDRISLDYDTLVSLMKYNHGLRIDQSELLKLAAKQADIQLTASDMVFLADFYKIVIDPHTVLNFEEGTLTGAVTLVRSKSQLEDEEILMYVANMFSNGMRRVRTDSDIGRLNEIMDVLGAKENRASRSGRYKIETINNVFREIILQDKWRVRNVEFFIKCATWIKAYAEDGNLAAMSNFTRLKCMVHKGAPIYSMEEA